MLTSYYLVRFKVSKLLLLIVGSKYKCHIFNTHILCLLLYVYILKKSNNCMILVLTWRSITKEDEFFDWTGHLCSSTENCTPHLALCCLHPYGKHTCLICLILNHVCKIRLPTVASCRRFPELEYVEWVNFACNQNKVLQCLHFRF